jgi:penicillin-binding protein 2
MSFRPLNSLPHGPHPGVGRLLVFRAVVIAAFLILAARIYQIQFLQREAYVLQADENRFDTVCIPATRGIITDRYGRPLAVNVASANVVVTPAELPEDDAEELAVLEHLAGLIAIPLSGELNTVDERGIPQRSLVTMVREGEGIAPYRGVVVKSDIDYDTARIIEAEQLPGVTVEWVSVRDYPTGSLTAHILGYMGPIPESRADEYREQCYVLDRDRIGYDGVEFNLEDWLAGRPGRQLVERDVAGLIIRTLGETPPVPGYSVQLTIDADLQESAQRHLVEELELMRSLYPENVIGFDRGVVIAMNPRTGEILAMVSWPTYDNQRFARAIDYPYYLQVSQDPLRPLFNQAVSSLYPPGSIFKVITATAVLEEGVVTPEYLIEDPGLIQLENRYYPNEPSQSQTFVCWINQDRGEGFGHGEVDLVRGLAWSCDVYFYKIGGGYTDPETGREEVAGIGLGIERLGQWMELFGLGAFSDIELAGEIDGTIPSPSWKRRTWGENWSTGDTYNSAFGQGYVLTTPLQMIRVINTLANNGIITRPTLVHEIYDANGNVVQGFQPDTTDMRDLLREWWPDTHDGALYPETFDATLGYIQEGMREAVLIEGGTAIGFQRDLPYVPVAGKTGTAEFCDNIAAALDRCIPGSWPAHAWFMGYAPYGNPEIAVIAFVYNGNEGATVALPVVTKVMEDYFRLKTERALQEQIQNATPTPPLPPAALPTSTAQP